MNESVEVIIISEDIGLFSFSVWDPKNGTNVMSYRGGGTIAPHTLQSINKEFFIAANNTKPMLHIWPVNNQDQLQNIRFVMPGNVTALAISPDGNYCIVGISENIYIWQICSGKMLANVSKHFQCITTIKFTDDGSHFITSGKDGTILIWNLGNVISSGATTLTMNSNFSGIGGGLANQKITPLHTLSDHALPVTDFHIGKCGVHAYLTSVSLDRTCKIYDISTGTLLLNIVFPEPLSSVTVNNLATRLYAGTTKGELYECNIQTPPRTKEYHMTNDGLQNVFVGHKKCPITNLSVSLDGETLLSGGDDHCVILWHIPSKQLIRTFSHRGKITNAYFTLSTKVMFNQDAKLQLLVKNFKRMIDSEVDDDHVIETLVRGEGINENAMDGIRSDDYDCHVPFNINNNEFFNNGTTRNGTSTTSTEDSVELERLRIEVKNLQRINKELFELHVNKSFLKN